MKRSGPAQGVLIAVEDAGGGVPPQLRATLFEPWEGDSVGFHERLESSLQSIRRLAIVHRPRTCGSVSPSFWPISACWKPAKKRSSKIRASSGSASARRFNADSNSR